MPQSLMRLCCVGLLASSLSAADYAEDTVQAVLPITTYSPAQVQSMEHARRTAGSTGTLYVSAMIMQRSEEFRSLLNKQGAAALAEHLLHSYGSDQASRDMAAAAAIFLDDYHYFDRKVKTGDRDLDRELGKRHNKKNADAEGLATATLELVDALAARPEPEAASAATEVLLQVLTETLASSHLYADNGRRTTPTMPEALAARAADFLDHADPFVRAMAEWAIEVKVGLDNDRQGDVWPGNAPPAWFTTWQNVPVADHLPFDYVRQAISLGMHRRAADLQRLASDVQRRAEAKATWATDAGGAPAAAVQALQQASSQLEQVLGAAPDLATARQAWLAWRQQVRRVVLQGPDIDFEQLIYLKRFSGGHHIQPSSHMNKYPGGGDLFVQDGLDPTAPSTALLNGQLDEGYVQDLDLWFDADRLVFAYGFKKANGKTQDLFEINIDGSGLRQLTDSQHHDVDPAYLPDGSVVFGSTRACAGIECAGGAYSQNNVFRVLPDGEVIRLTYSPDDDAYPFVLNDGRVVYMRWNYQERGVDEEFSLWVVRPDGSGNDGLYRVHINDQYIIQALKDARPIPGTRKLVAMGSSHRCGNEGMVAIGDLSAGINNPEGIRSVTPYHSAIGRGVGSLMRPVEEGGVPYFGGYYVKPVALSEKSFVVSSNYDMPASCNFQAYYIDVWGNKELLHRDKLLETVAIMPLKPRVKPPVIPDTRDESKSYATCFVENVYKDLPGVEKGEVKHLRVLEQIFTVNDGRGTKLLFDDNWANTGGTLQGATRIIGTVPVAEDGSAAFEVPAKAPIYFQALDEHWRGIQRMRTHVEFAPGEVRGCVGCHETRDDVVQVRNMGSAMKTKPHRPEPPPWGSNTFISYRNMIQPIFTAKCVKCHNSKAAEGNLVLTDEEDQQGYLQSYRSLYGMPAGKPLPKSWRRVKDDNTRFKSMFHEVANILDETLGEVTQPKQFGAPRSFLATHLINDPEHQNLLSADEKRLIMAWLDVRAPYYDSYYQRKGKKKEYVNLIPYAPFELSREHRIE